MIKQKKNYKIYILLFLILSLLISFLPFSLIKVSADEITYSNVLDDLKKDETFDITNYPTNKEDNSIQIITIAESENNELFVYTYQPSGETKNIKATCINMSLAEDFANAELYDLELINSSGTLYKYKVKDFTVFDFMEIRYYNIASIFRQTSESLGDEIVDKNGNTISEVSYEVGKAFIVTKDSISYTEVETIEITDKYVGFVRYDDGYVGFPSMGLSWYYPGMDSHFIAFSTDKRMDKLMEAEVYFQRQDYHYFKSATLAITFAEEQKFGPITDEYRTPTYLDKHEETLGIGAYKYTYTWDRIQTVEDFINTENREYLFTNGFFNVTTQYKITDEGLNDLSNKQWVIRFFESEYKNSKTNVSGDNPIQTINTEIDYTIVSNVTILRLKFETDGVVYNLGVVDNKQTGDQKPDNESQTIIQVNPDLLKGFEDFFKNTKNIVKSILITIVVVILIIVLCSIFGIKNVILFIPKCIWYLLKGLWWLISAPVRIFKDKGE